MDAEAVKKIIRDHPEVIAYSFEDVRLSMVSVTHCFEFSQRYPSFKNLANFEGRNLQRKSAVHL